MNIEKVKAVYDDAISDLAGRKYESAREYGVAVYEIGGPDNFKSVEFRKLYAYFDGDEWVFRLPETGIPSMCLRVKRLGGYQESQGYPKLSELFDEIGLTDRIRMFVGGEQVKCEFCSKKASLFTFRGEVPVFQQLALCEECAQSFVDKGYGTFALADCEMVVPGGLIIGGYTFDLIVPNLERFKKKHGEWSADPSSMPNCTEVRFAEDFLSKTRDLVVNL